MTSGRPDSDLIAGSRAEPAMFSEIFDRHHRELYRYLRSRVGAELAADLAAETFVTAFARRGAYRAETADARPWLYGIAHNLLRNHKRHEQRRLAAYARHGAQPLADPAALAEFSLADARADAAAAGGLLARVLAKMPAGDRDVLLLFAWADMSYAEVAQALDIPVGTVRSRLNRAEFIVMYGYPASGALRDQWIDNGLSGRLAWLVGPTGERLMTWAQFQRLPTAPDQLQAVVARASSNLGPGIPPPATEFSLIANLLASAPGSPALRSALYRVAARLPGLALVPRARDLIGRVAAEVYVPLENAAIPGGNALYFNPLTGAALDVARPAQSPQCPDIFQEAVLASGYVSSNHQLPAGAVPTARPVPQLSMFPACGVKPTVLPTPAPPSTPTTSPSGTAIPSPSVSPSPTGGPSPSATGVPSPSVSRS